MRTEEEPSAVGLLRISRERDGGVTVNSRGWQEDRTLSTRFWSEAVTERRVRPASSTSGRASAPGPPDAPQLEGTGEIRVGNRRPRHGVLDERGRIANPR